MYLIRFARLSTLCHFFKFFFCYFRQVFVFSLFISFGSLCVPDILWGGRDVVPGLATLSPE